MTHSPRGVFVGLATLDVIQRVAGLPRRNTKVTALRQDVSGGGPALNAAVVFATLGGEATLVTRLGNSQIGRLVRADIESRGVTVADLATSSFVPSVSTVTVDEATGDRQIVSMDAHGGTVREGTLPPRQSDGVQEEVEAHLSLLGAVDVVHVDGHHADLARAAAQWAHRRSFPLVIDAGRWKTSMGELIEVATDVVCSADFEVPGIQVDLLSWLVSKGVSMAAVTNGPAAVEWATPSARGAIMPPTTNVVDTLGAGDFFHGAYSFARSFRDEHGLPVAGTTCLEFACTVAAVKVASAGTRDWLRAVTGLSPVNFERHRSS